VGQLHLDQVAEARQGILHVRARRAQPAELQAAGGEPVTVADEGGVVVQHPPRLVCWCDHPALLGQAAGVVEASGVASSAGRRSLEHTFKPGQPRSARPCGKWLWLLVFAGGFVLRRFEPADDEPVGTERRT
jgi:hypothetical protein